MVDEQTIPGAGAKVVRTNTLSNIGTALSTAGHLGEGAHQSSPLSLSHGELGCGFSFLLDTTVPVELVILA